jgi:NAD(P)-dependent dehydrogenase (short-subunit alcohol dehydrogenase family)
MSLIKRRLISEAVASWIEGVLMSEVMIRKIAFVTGGGSGIGEASAKALAAAGASVAIADMNIAGADRVVSEIVALGGSAKSYKLDVSDDAAVGDVIKAVEKDFGGLHIAVNNAGIGGDQAPTGDQSVEGWRKVMSVNLDGVFYCMRHEIAVMKKYRSGSIINMASILGAVAFANSAGYVAAKHGVIGLTQTAAIEYATVGIRVNAVGPGFIATPLLDALPADALTGIAAMHPMNRLGTSEEVAALVLFLASDEASFITGGYYPVDGGYLAR